MLTELLAALINHLCCICLIESQQFRKTWAVPFVSGNPSALAFNSIFVSPKNCLNLFFGNSTGVALESFLDALCFDPTFVFLITWVFNTLSLHRRIVFTFFAGKLCILQCFFYRPFKLSWVLRFFFFFFLGGLLSKNI